ncbi:MAG: two-component sensor histidine kinase [Blautia sp.]|nr:two-component sensor histidine kinase [Blautia sp.]
MKRQTSFFGSLRFRLLIILIVLGILPGIIAIHAIVSSYQSMAIDSSTRQIRRDATVLAEYLAKRDYLSEPDQGQANSRLNLIADIHEGRILVLNRNFQVVRDTFNAEDGQIIVSPLVNRCFRGEIPFRHDSHQQTLEMAVPITSPEEDGILGVLLITASASEMADTLLALEQREILLMGIIAALVVLCSYFVSTILVRPFARVTKSIEDLTDGYQSGEISVRGYTETTLITGAFNKLLARMKVLDDSRNEFVSNVSHELKTPMTSVKVLADSLLGQSGLDESLYQEYLSDITQEIDRENKIISDLLSLVKLDKTASGMHIVHVEINTLLENILKRLQPIANMRKIDLFLDSFRTVEADIDEVRFVSAISNLVENAIKYNVDDGWVRVTLNADHQYMTIDVSDSGSGIPAEACEKIFERFYRVDKSHSREIGGTGLGLAIARSAILAHHGTITVDSILGSGTTFHVRMPLTYIP